MSDSNSTKILLIDDHALVRQGLAALIDAEGGMHVTGQAGDPGEALRLLGTLSPDLVIVDIALGGADGLDLIGQIHGRWPMVLILALSMHSEMLYAERSLRAGASGYLMKEQAVEELISALHRLVAGDVYLSDQFERHLLKRLRGSERMEGLPADSLTNRELAVLRLIGSGRTTRQVAESLNLSVKTVQSHQEHLKSKLHLANATELVRYATLWMQREMGG